ncbi:MAG: adenylosuccinate lyase [Hydrogenibacillus sp.]|nr:adenylosuccinate lyase [Hydrogenibacillus sp.]
MIERYTRPEMGAVWSEARKFEIWREIEVLAVEGWAAIGVVPAAEAAEIRAKARVDLSRIAELEETTRHDVVAFTRQLSETLGPERRWVHYGLTSADIVDTAIAVRLKEANAILWRDLVALVDALTDLSLAHRDTVMIGRTHGVHAEPTTFGLKMAYFREEVRRHMARLREIEPRLYVGKISGAVGTYASVPPEVEAYVLLRLGLSPAPVALQTLSRERHAEYMAFLALVASTAEKIAVELRHLARTEVGEVEEGFLPGQKGSSAMPHKKNPIGLENVTGLARLVRGYLVPALENVALWHERDISHSSVERVALSDATIALDYLLARLASILKRLVVRPERMRANLARTGGLYFSGRVVGALVRAGWSREAAYDRVQAHALAAWEGPPAFDVRIRQDAAIAETLGAAGLAAALDANDYLRHVPDIFRRLGLDGAAPSTFPAGRGGRGANGPDAHGGRGDAGCERHKACGPFGGGAMMDGIERGVLRGRGKAKDVYATNRPDVLWLEYRDDLTAFDGKKKDTREGKGALVNALSSYFFTYLARHGVRTHFIRQRDGRVQLVRKLAMIPLEVVVRYTVAGSLAKRLGWAEGTALSRPIVEFYYKRDDLGDPLLAESHIAALGIAQPETLRAIEETALWVGDLIRAHVHDAGLRLIDFKLEFGRDAAGALVLGDEISPETCRFWDAETNAPLDKDRFRRDLGDVLEGYRIVAERLGVKVPEPTRDWPN